MAARLQILHLTSPMLTPRACHRSLIPHTLPARRTATTTTTNHLSRAATRRCAYSKASSPRKRQRPALKEAPSARPLCIHTTNSRVYLAYSSSPFISLFSSTAQPPSSLPMPTPADSDHPLDPPPLVFSKSEGVLGVENSDGSGAIPIQAHIQGAFSAPETQELHRLGDLQELGLGMEWSV